MPVNEPTSKVTLPENVTGTVFATVTIPIEAGEAPSVVVVKPMKPLASASVIFPVPMFAVTNPIKAGEAPRVPVIRPMNPFESERVRLPRIPVREPTSNVILPEKVTGTVLATVTSPI